MTRDEFKKERYEISFTAGMNHRYHQARAHTWTIWNRCIQIAVGALAVIALCFAVVAGTMETRWADAGAITSAALAAIMAIALNVVPVGDWVQHHLDLFRRWSDLREDIDSLRFEESSISPDGSPSPEIAERLKSLAAKVHRIGALEPPAHPGLLTKCYRDEERSRLGEKEAPPTAEVAGSFGLPGWS